jgi:hypothetical protein
VESTTPQRKNDMNTHLIEWKRLVKQGRTCDRCNDTGATLRQVIRELNTRCARGRVRFRLKTTRLPVSRLEESNVILVDGRPLERIVPGARRVETDCPSCGELTGTPTKCRALAVKGQTHESLPAELIRAAICRMADCCGAGCEWDCGCESGRHKGFRAQGCA